MKSKGNNYILIKARAIDGEVLEVEVPAKGVATITADGNDIAFSKYLSSRVRNDVCVLIEDKIDIVFKENPVAFCRYDSRLNLDSTPFKKFTVKELFGCESITSYIEEIICGKLTIAIKPSEATYVDERTFIGMCLFENDQQEVGLRERLIPPEVSGLEIGDPCFSLFDDECDYNCENCEYNFSIKNNDPYKNYVDIDDIDFAEAIKKEVKENTKGNSRKCFGISTNVAI